MRKLPNFNVDAFWKLKPEGNEKYNAYLCSREWSEKKRAVHRRANGLCERCRKYPIDNVHHLTYERKYNERLEDLVGLCRRCHEYTHGHSDFDPARKTLYLAGKIEKHCWRHKIVSGLKIHQGEGWRGERWPILSGAIRLDGIIADYSGPYFVGCDHGCFHDLQHAWGNGFCGDADPDFGVVDLCTRAIQGADIVFAWINTNDCFGTIAELGMAHALGKTIWVATPKPDPELWFVYRLGKVHVCNDPRESLIAFFSGQVETLDLVGWLCDWHTPYRKSGWRGWRDCWEVEEDPEPCFSGESCLYDAQPVDYDEEDEFDIDAFDQKFRKPTLLT
jgi:hypothetical protein